MKHYTYMLSSKIDEMKYIGVRSCEGNPEDDYYWGSSKYLPENVSEICEKQILMVFESREEAVKHEIELHEKFNVAVNDKFWNKAKQTSTKFDTSGVKFTKTNVSNYLNNTNGFKKGGTAWNKGLKCPEVSERQKTNNSFSGKKHTDEWRKNHSESMKRIWAERKAKKEKAEQ